MNLLNTLIQGTLLGGHYALLACGLAFMFQVMQVINLAHGSLAVMAGFAFLAISAVLGINPFIVLIIVIPGMALVGWGLQVGVLERSTKYGLLVPILATFGLAILINNLLFEHFGADPVSLAPNIGSLSFSSWAIGGNIYIGKLAALIFAVAVGLLVSLSLFLNRTPLGRAIRATATDPDVVGLLGINPRFINIVASAIALVTVGIAGMFLTMRGSVTPYSGMGVLLFAFEAAVIGGEGSLWRTLLGGILLGVVQSLGALINPQGFLIAGHAFFLVVVMVRVMLSGRVMYRIKTRLLQWI
ncbi:MAG TPA: branched-chain amino acid ABC transporter permease [Nevskiaceae bacterium]